MTNRKVDIENLGAAIVEFIREYTEDVALAVKKEVASTAKEARDQLEEKSPELTGEYKAGWRVKNNDDEGAASRILYNKTDYQLVHLLEFGHASRNGGRVRAHPHVAKTVDPLLEEMHENIKDIVRRGGK